MREATRSLKCHQKNTILITLHSPSEQYREYIKNRIKLNEIIAILGALENFTWLERGHRLIIINESYRVYLISAT